MRGGRSPSQSKPGSTTTERGMASAESSSSRSRSALSVSSGVYGNALACSQRTRPSIALAYGSMSSLAGLKRRPSSGS